MFKRLRTFIRTIHRDVLDLAEDFKECLEDNFKDLIQNSRGLFQKDIDTSKRIFYATQAGEYLLAFIMLPIIIIICIIAVMVDGISEAFANYS